MLLAGSRVKKASISVLLITLSVTLALFVSEGALTAYYYLKEGTLTGPTSSQLGRTHFKRHSDLQ